MNLMHIKYAVEVANEGSINKAAEKLYVGQPNLSRAIKELEASLGVKIFERSAKGMGLTSDGETFIRYAKTILRQVDEVESIFNGFGEKALLYFRAEGELYLGRLCKIFTFSHKRSGSGDHI